MSSHLAGLGSTCGPRPLGDHTSTRLRHALRPGRDRRRCPSPLGLSPPQSRPSPRVYHASFFCLPFSVTTTTDRAVDSSSPTCYRPPVRGMRRGLIETARIGLRMGLRTAPSTSAAQRSRAPALHPGLAHRAAPPKTPGPPLPHPESSFPRAASRHRQPGARERFRQAPHPLPTYGDTGSLASDVSAA
jgi:hypothetical protein